MNNIVSFETAKRLKEAGFPQPEFATGQMWYNEYGAITFLSKMEIDEEGFHVSFFCISVASGRTDRIIPIHEGAYFAPTPTDILPALGPGFLLYFDFIRAMWVLLESNPYGIYTEHGRASEACALAWLQLNEK